MNSLKYKFCTYSLLLFAVLMGGCVTPQNQEYSKKKEIDKIFFRFYEMNDFNERSFAYYQHCLNGEEPINKKFLENMEYVANQLLDVSIDKYGWEPEYVVSQILKRRAYIKQNLSEHYHTKGCHSLEGNEAAKNYRAVSKMTKREIQ